MIYLQKGKDQESLEERSKHCFMVLQSGMETLCMCMRGDFFILNCVA